MTTKVQSMNATDEAQPAKEKNPAVVLVTYIVGAFVVWYLKQSLTAFFAKLSSYYGCRNTSWVPCASRYCSTFCSSARNLTYLFAPNALL
jgi:hypothetical protein